MPQADILVKRYLNYFLCGLPEYSGTIYNKTLCSLEFQMIEQSAFDEMKTLVTTLRERAERFRELFSPPQPRRWLTAEEVCKALRITKRALQYYRSEGIIPSTSLGNKILYKESDIARILQNNLIAPSK